MKLRILFLTIVFSIFLSSFIHAQTIEILGTEIPLMKGARRLDSKESTIIQARVVSYIVNTSLSEAIEFYRIFFKENDFYLMGGEGKEGFNASVKKDEIMFTIKIYAKDKRTVIQFIW